MKMDIHIKRTNEDELLMLTFNETCDSNSCVEIYDDFLGLNLAKGENANITFDTDNRVYYIEKSGRAVGWYLTIYKAGTGVRPRHWNGNNWCANRASKEPYYDGGGITVISDLLPENDYLKTLE